MQIDKFKAKLDAIMMKEEDATKLDTLNELNKAKSIFEKKGSKMDEATYDYFRKSIAEGQELVNSKHKELTQTPQNEQKTNINIDTNNGTVVDGSVNINGSITIGDVAQNGDQNGGVNQRTVIGSNFNFGNVGSTGAANDTAGNVGSTGAKNNTPANDTAVPVKKPKKPPVNNDTKPPVADSKPPIGNNPKSPVDGNKKDVGDGKKAGWVNLQPGPKRQDWKPSDSVHIEGLTPEQKAALDQCKTTEEVCKLLESWGIPFNKVY